ncbi:MAG: hypothetical protein ACLFNQ_10965 [Spirochaetaceae bacterium]
MPWKFLLFLVGLALVIVFAGLNISNSTDISFGFHTFEDVPVFMGLGSAYLLGALTILPFTLTKALKKRRELSTRYKKDRKKSAEANEKPKSSRLKRSRQKAITGNESTARGPETTATEKDPPVPPRPS